MAESDMRDELQRIADRSSRSNEEARRDAQTAVRKAARRSHWLAGVTITLWLLTAGGIVALLFGYLVLFLPWMSEWGERVAKLTTSTVAASDSDIAVLSHTHQALRSIGLYMSYGGMIVAGLMALAAASTIAFVYASRQATLKQIQISLAEIVAQFEQQSVQ